jgi:hypothetical protein
MSSTVSCKAAGRRPAGDIGALGRGPAGRTRREIVGLQIGRVGQDDGAIDRVLQLADVAGPVVGGEQGQGLGAGADHALAFLDIEAADEVLDQGRDVLAPLAQGRRLDGEDVQAIDRGPRGNGRP